MSYETEMRRIIDNIASKAEMDSSELTQEEYCKLHPEDPICRSYAEVYPKMQMYQPPQEPEPEDQRGPEPEPEPEEPPKPLPEEPPKPPIEEEAPPTLPPKPPPRDDIPSLPKDEYTGADNAYRGVMGGTAMSTKSCPVCGATVPDGTNFCARCGTIIEVLPRGTGGTGAGGKGGTS